MPKARLTSAFSSASLLVASVLAVAQATPPGDTIKIGSRDVTVKWPVASASQVVKVGDQSLRVVSGDILGPVTGVGGWDDIRARWKALPPSAGPSYKVFVVVPKVTSRVLVAPDRIQSVQSLITDVEVDDIYQSLALFKTALEVLDGGSRKVEFEVLADEDTAYGVGDDPAVAESVSRFSRVRATNTVGTAPGGFEFGFVVYDSRKALDLPAEMNGIPVGAVPFRLFSSDGRPASLAATLLDQWLASFSDAKPWANVSAESPALPLQAWDSLSARGVTPAPDQRSAFSFHRETPAVTGLSWVGKRDFKGEIVGEEALVQAVKGAGAGKDPNKTLAQELGAPDLPVPSAFGDYAVTGQGRLTVTTGTRWHNRGRVLVHRFDQALAGGLMSVQADMQGLDVLDLVLRDAGGNELARWPLSTHTTPVGPVIKVTTGASATLKLRASSPRPGATLWVEESEISKSFGRQSTDQTSLTLSDISYGPGEGATELAAPTPPSAGSKEGLTSNDAEVQSASARLYWNQKDVSVEPALTALAKSGHTAAVYSACEALALQGTPTSVKALKSIVVSGPFDLNRLIALRAMANHAIPLATGDLWRALGAQSWRLRALATQLVAKSDGKDKNILLTTMLIDAEPAVRELVAQIADPDDPNLSKRLLFIAVNDVSDAVRLAACSTLLKSKDSHIREEVLKLVRDDSTYVATAVLKMLIGREEASDLNAVRLALVDRRPVVQASALLVAAARPGDWELDDIRSATKSDDPRVQEGLLALAAKYPKLVPSDVLGKIASGKDAWLAAQAKRILGSGS